RLKVTPADVSRTSFIEKGNFFVSFACHNNKESAVDLIIDPSIVFGQSTSLELPANFIDSKTFSVPTKQTLEGYIPGAFAFKKALLKAGAELAIRSVFGQIDNLPILNKIKNRIARKKYFEQKAKENKSLIDDICDSMKIETSSRTFDLYSQQTFLDNTMRGGLPITFDGKVLYLYYRKHGDMERDYNDFKLVPTYFSQGNGNYRDINQNRRNDVFFNPEVAEDNIIRFFNLTQLDGFNPLVVLGSKFYLESEKAAKKLLDKHVKDYNDSFAKELLSPLLVGPYLKGLEEAGVQFKTTKVAFATDLINSAKMVEDANHGEGYWIDHFFYNTDLLESFECIYPEKLHDILFNQKIFTYYDNDHVVLSRKGKYCVDEGQAKQYESVKVDPDKTKLINSRAVNPNAVRTKQGKGEIYTSTLASKLLCIIANKAASFDAQGIGLEMEANKPDWYDALNGLPALFGSSLSESLELKRLCQYVLDQTTDDVSAEIPTELKELIDGLKQKLVAFFGSENSFEYWDQTYVLKEAYREKTKFGIEGTENTVDAKYIKDFLIQVAEKCEAGVKKCLKKYKNYYTYFINEATDYELNNCEVKIKAFTQKPLPLFLEGFVHALKVVKDKKIYQLVKESPLYDKKLKMYKVNASLKDTPIEIGRARIFAPGWLENESIWLHMEYKYMLELIKAGMYEEFFADFKNVIVPFLKPAQYKRSTLENSSFIASSAHPDKEKHGRGFVARLSGGAAEFIDMWLNMTSGKKIFYQDQGKLCFKLSPILPNWLFKNGQLSFTLLSCIDVVYINKAKKNTYGGGVSPVAYKLIYNDKEIDIEGSFVPEPYSQTIRNREVKKIVVTLA
ncbi:MAG: cellobiose phosphorylase, partial [Candidatus Margulisbacteria bacterium]|nr:cellobiose phosphorylase [Candidatus Margulisiibacteriota bacterium]